MRDFAQSPGAFQTAVYIEEDVIYRDDYNREKKSFANQKQEIFKGIVHGGGGVADF